MRIRYLQVRHVFATLLILCAVVFLWRTALALSAGATADKVMKLRADLSNMHLIDDGTGRVL